MRVNMLMHGLVDQVIGAFPDAGRELKENVRRQFQSSHIPQYFDALPRHALATISSTRSSIRCCGFWRSPRVTSWRETARELVSLNVFKKRIMAQKQTVGGAIDVAVISRESGFQWQSRQDGG